VAFVENERIGLVLNRGVFLQGDIPDRAAGIGEVDADEAVFQDGGFRLPASLRVVGPACSGTPSWEAVCRTSDAEGCGGGAKR
jgi:hypothetical protein